MYEVNAIEMDRVTGADGPFGPGDSVTIGFPPSITFGERSMNRIVGAVRDLVLGPGPSAYSARTNDSAYSAVARPPTRPDGSRIYFPG